MPGVSKVSTISISIHAPREGCDPRHLLVVLAHIISIHAPREGCDAALSTSCHRSIDFNPRTPRGVRHPCPSSCSGSNIFQSTHPARGATGQCQHGGAGTIVISIHAPREGCDAANVEEHIRIVRISIHAPREGCDLIKFNSLTPESQFQSTHPARGATFDYHAFREDFGISIHAPREGCDS